MEICLTNIEMISAELGCNFPHSFDSSLLPGSTGSISIDLARLTDCFVCTYSIVDSQLHLQECGSGLLLRCAHFTPILVHHVLNLLNAGWDSNATLVYLAIVGAGQHFELGAWRGVSLLELACFLRIKTKLVAFLKSCGMLRIYICSCVFLSHIDRACILLTFAISNRNLCSLQSLPLSRRRLNGTKHRLLCSSAHDRRIQICIASIACVGNLVSCVNFL